MLVQSNPLVDWTNEVRTEKLDPRGDVGNDVAEGESSLGTWHDDLAELDVASRAPCEHARSPGASESDHRIAADSSRRLCVARTVLDNTAAICWAAKDFVARAEAIQDFQAEKRDVGCLEHVAAQIHHDLGCGTGVSAGRSSHTGN